MQIAFTCIHFWDTIFIQTKTFVIIECKIFPKLTRNKLLRNNLNLSPKTFQHFSDYNFRLLLMFADFLHFISLDFHFRSSCSSEQIQTDFFIYANICFLDKAKDYSTRSVFTNIHSVYTSSYSYDHVLLRSFQTDYTNLKQNLLIKHSPKLPHSYALRICCTIALKRLISPSLSRL